MSSARAAQIAALDTRTAKEPDLEVDELRVDWREIAADHDIDSAALADLVGRVQVTPISATAAQRVNAAMVGRDGLTAHASTFDRRHVLQGWCNQLPHGAPIVDIERLAAGTLASAEVVTLQGESATVAMRRRDRRRMEAPSLGARYSTAELLILEAWLAANAMQRAHEVTATVDRDTVDLTVRARPFLSDEQRAMVHTLATSGRGVDVVIAPAGSGKRTALAAAGEAWQLAGYRVIGCAVAAKAARQLEATAGIPSNTIAALSKDLARGAQFNPGTVLIIDEAGMAGTRTLEPLLTAAQFAHAKVVLVGDTKQLPEIDAGGLLRGLDHRLGGVHLHNNRRQRNEWERLALAQLRDGRLPEALNAYQSHDRFTVTATAAAARERIAADYATAHLRGEHTVMLAMRWRDVHDLNRLARSLLADAGLLDGPVLNINQRPYQRGDRIMTLKNARRLGIANGTTGTVTAIDTATRTLTLRTDEGSTVTLPATYLDADAVVHAYATTVHKAQGTTVDRAFVYADDQLARESGYTALSRGALENRVYLVGTPTIEHDHGHLHTRDPLDRLGRNLERSEAQHLAIDHGVGVEID
jgi:ATP-dependent exoDNAse (exonuclease V) alpha subunit